MSSPPRSDRSPRAVPAVAPDDARLRGVLEAAPDAMVVADLTGRIVLLNAQAERLFGYDRAELLGQPVEVLLPARVRRAHARHRATYAAAPSVRGMGAGLELAGRRRDGSEVPVEISLSPLVVDGTTWVLSAIRDISDRRASEGALRQAVAAAEAANRAKSEFLSRMSHELRTPLNAILGFGQLLELDGLPPAQDANVKRILTAGRHLLDLINEVLDIARIETGRLPLSPEPVRLGDVVRETLDLARPLAAAHRVQLDAAGLEGSCGAVFVLADRQRYKQVVLNLLSNAVKYNHPEGRVMLLCEPAAEWVRLGVRDTGPGIAPTQLPRLFQPFERLGAETSGVEGVGLGLALSKGLMEAMGGSLTVESALDVGSTFWTSLPASAHPLASHATAAGAAPAPVRGGALRTVLYIEDNLPNLELVEQLLGRWSDVALLAAMQGQRGLELAIEQPPDLILLDVHLPDLDGGAVLRRLQAEARTRAIPVVVVSADATDGQVRRLLALGARAYLTKPFDVRQFLAVIGELLDA